MPKMVHRAPDGSYLGLIDREDPQEPISAPPTPPAAPSLADPSDMKYADLRREAGELKVKGYASMKRADLEDAVGAARGGD